MNFSYIKLHAFRFLLLITLIVSTVLLTANLGTSKSLYHADCYDIAGEAGITLVTLIWIFFILLSRPAGQVTNLLFCGLTLTHISMLLDLMDEFLAYPENNAWITTIESLPAPFGMVIMTLGLYRWHQEQCVLNNQLRKTERYHREHSFIDFTTGLYSAEYMKRQLQFELNHVKANQAVCSLILLDLKDFSTFNWQHGEDQGDQLLREVSQLIKMNIRAQDLACRYASDRFIVLLPGTHLYDAQQISLHIENSVSHLAFKKDDSVKAIFPSIVTCTKEYRGWHDYQDILTDINSELAFKKKEHLSKAAV